MTSAQLNIIDSLKGLLSHHEKNDTVRALLLVNLSKSYAQSSPDTSLLFAIDGYMISKRNNFLKGEEESLNRMGIAYTRLGNYSQALKLLIQSLKLNEKIGNDLGEISNLNNIGNIYSEQGDFQQALEYYFKSKELSEKIGLLSPIILINISENYYFLKRFDSAKIFAQEANIRAGKINLYRVLGNSYKVMGDISFETGENSLALEYYRLSIPYLFKAGNLVVLSGCYSGMAKAFEKSGKLDSCLLYGRQAYSIAKKNSFGKQLLDAGKFFSSFYRMHRNSDSLIFYMDATRVVNDSLFSQQKSNELRSLAIDEKMRQQEIQMAEVKSMDERNHNLQYAAIAVGLITFIILFVFLSRSIIVKTKFIEFFGVLGLLSIFEFINLFIHPYLSHATNDSPVLMLLILIAIGALLVPLHHRLEKWMTKAMVEKNKKIRLEAAKRTIQNLEG